MDTDSGTCLLESEDGQLLSEKQDGQTIDRSGPGAVHANRLVVRGPKKEKQTRDIFGRNSTDLSKHERLSLCLANRLRQKTDLLGSTMYKLTWTARATPLGVSIPALRASVRRISDKDSTGVQHGRPTPRADPRHCNGNQDRALSHNSRLEDMVFLCPWPTPAARDWKSTASNMHGTNARPLNEVARLSGYPTPRATDAEKNVRTLNGVLMEILRKGSPQDLNQAAAMVRQTVTGETQNGSTAETTSGVQLSPELPCWLMGFPIEFLSCVDLAMQSSSHKRKRLSKA